MKKAISRGGFTLAELLIVLAIIAVLITILIPVFSASMEKSREAVDLANVRSAYAKVTVAGLTGDTASPNANGVIFMHDRWYINVPLTQQQAGWQNGGDLTVGSVSSNDPLHWVGSPAPGSICTVSYSKEGGTVLAWVYNFAQITNSVTVPGTGTYSGYTVSQLLHDKSFSMLESSGATGQLIDSEIKHQLGLNATDAFSYKILPAKGMGANYYEIYISTAYSLKPNNPKKDAKNVGTIPVTGYIYRIEPDGSSTLITTGTTQELVIYTNTSGHEKIDVYGDQYKGGTPTNPVYNWD